MITQGSMHRLARDLLLSFAKEGPAAFCTLAELKLPDFCFGGGRAQSERYESVLMIGT